MRHIGRGLLVPRCPATTLDRRQRAMPVCRTLRRNVSKPGVAAVAGEAEKTKRFGAAVRSLVFETCGRHQVAAWFGGNGGGKRTVEPACCQTMEDPVGASVADCKQIASAGIQGSRSGLLLSLLCCWESSVYSSVWRCLHCDSHVKVRVTETDRDRDTIFLHAE